MLPSSNRSNRFKSLQERSCWGLVCSTTRYSCGRCMSTFLSVCIISFKMLSGIYPHRNSLTGLFLTAPGCSSPHQARMNKSSPILRHLPRIGPAIRFSAIAPLNAKFGPLEVYRGYIPSSNIHSRCTLPTFKTEDVSALHKCRIILPLPLHT
jgi:hypothetical protein